MRKRQAKKIVAKCYRTDTKYRKRTTDKATDKWIIARCQRIDVAEIFERRVSFYE